MHSIIIMIAHTRTCNEHAITVQVADLQPRLRNWDAHHESTVLLQYNPPTAEIASRPGSRVRLPY